MSYCRFSSDGFQCDLYCYESDEGYCTHIASQRRVLPIPQHNLDDFDSSNFEKINELADLAQNEDLNPSFPIGLPHDGESFTDGDLESFLERLKYLKKVGYLFSDRVIECVEEELKQEELKQENLKEDNFKDHQKPSLKI